MQVFVGLQFEDHQARIAVEGEQVQHAALAAGERGDLGVQQIAAQIGKEFVESQAQPRLKPALRRHAKERIGVRAVGMAAEEETPKEIAAEVFVFRGERSLVRAGAEGDFILAREGVRRNALADARKLKPVQQQRDFGGGARMNLDALAGRIGNEREEAVDCRPWQRSSAAADENA